MRNDELWGNIRKGFTKIHDELDSAARERTAIKADVAAIKADQHRQGRQIEELDAKADEATKERQRLSGQVEELNAKAGEATKDRQRMSGQIGELVGRADEATKERQRLSGQIEELNAKADEATKDRQRMSGQIEGVDAHVRGLAQVLVDTGQLRRDETDEAARAAGTVTVRRRTRRPPGP